MVRLLCKIIALAAIVYYVPRFCYRQTEGFTLTKIHSELPYVEEWETDCGNLPDIFDQKFTYLAAGGQAYAFVSEDGKYVLKFFKHHLRRLPFWLKYLPLPKKYALQREQQRLKREKKLQRDFRSYHLAYQYLPEESGLLYVHLNKTNFLQKKARILDKLGIEHTIDLDQIEFILQKKADLAFPYLAELIEQENWENAKNCIDSICEMVINRCRKGIYDEDPRIHRNVGFVNGKAMMIDIGRFKSDPSRENPEVQKKDLVEITWRLRRYLAEVSPDLEQYLVHKLYD